MQPYNLTGRTRQVITFAREEALRLRHRYVGGEHLLLGLVREGEGVACAVLELLGTSGERIRQRIEEIVRRGEDATGASSPAAADGFVAYAGGPSGAAAADFLPFTSRAKKALELAMAEAHELGHVYVGTEHVLLGLLREEHGIAAQLLNDAGVTLDAARAETLRLLGTAAPPDRPAAAPAALRDLVSVTVELRYRDGRVMRHECASIEAAISYLGA